MTLRQLFISLSVISIPIIPAYADKITVDNRTSDTIYVTPYYVPKNTKKQATKAGDTIKIDGQQKTVLERPPLGLTSYLSIDRVLLLSYDNQEAQQQFSVPEIREKSLLPIGNLQGSTFYISSENTFLKGYNSAEWNLVNPFLKAFQQAKAVYKAAGITPAIGTNPSIINTIAAAKLAAWQQENPYRTQTAYVVLRNDMGEDEKKFIQANADSVKDTLEKFIGTPINGKAPRIALCFSGGGYRAMLYTLGSLKGLQEAGLLSGITYAAGLSGSTWALSPLLETKSELDAYINTVIPRLQANFFQPFVDVDLIINTLGKKMIFGQPISLIDIYGNMLIHYLLQNPNLTLKTARYGFPYPIYTAVITRSKDQEHQSSVYYKWIEFTPHEVSSVDPAYLGTIPTWAFNRKFSNGVSTIHAPPSNLGFLMGIWGSALSANVNEIVQSSLPSQYTPHYVMAKILVEKAIQSATNDQVNVGATRFKPAKINNFAQGFASSPRANDAEITLIDGGVAFNLPTPPLLKPTRGIDIIIIVDASASVTDASELKKAAEYARINNLKFPPIANYQQAGIQPISIFTDPEDPTVPTVIYLPRVGLDVNGQLPDFAGTFNFTYTPAQAMTVIDTAKNVILNNKQIIIDALKTKIT